MFNLKQNTHNVKNTTDSAVNLFQKALINIHNLQVYQVAICSKVSPKSSDKKPKAKHCHFGTKMKLRCIRDMCTDH